uniref:Uncharacterized protein n=1 Tax=Romanomermis culicivorax TaxID=13658 RepID=A0A915J5P3_ROMCU
MVRKLVRKVHPDFEKEKFMAAFEKVQHIRIKRPKTGAVYRILTDEGEQRFLAHRASPLIVEAESLPIMNIIQPTSDPYLMLKVPPSYLDFKQLIDQIENIFHEVALVNRLQSTPENFLSFIQGALEFNYKLNEDLRIRPYFDLFDNSYRKLFLQKSAGQGWISSEVPMVIIASQFEDDVDYD